MPVLGPAIFWTGRLGYLASMKLYKISEERLSERNKKIMKEFLAVISNAGGIVPLLGTIVGVDRLLFHRKSGTVDQDKKHRKILQGIAECIPVLGPVVFWTARLGHLTIKAYKTAVSKAVVCADKNDSDLLKGIGTLVIEPWQCFKQALLNPFGWNENMTHCGMNPTHLSAEQATCDPILFIHGNDPFNQASGISLVKKLKKEGLGPVFTVNLPNDDDDEDQTRVVNKIQEILKLYQPHSTANSVKIHLIGHSRGGYLAYNTLFDKIWKIDTDTNESAEQDLQPQKPDLSRIGKVITLGVDMAEFSTEEDNNFILTHYPEKPKDFLQIAGAYDVCSPPPKELSDNGTSYLTISEGHSGMLFSSKAHRAIVEFIKK